MLITDLSLTKVSVNAIIVDLNDQCGNTAKLCQAYAEDRHRVNEICIPTDDAAIILP